MGGDGAARVESFKSKRAFEARLRELEDELLADHLDGIGLVASAACDDCPAPPSLPTTLPRTRS